MQIRPTLALTAALLLAACDRAPPPAPPAPQPVLVAPHPGPVLRDTLPVIEPRQRVPLPHSRPRPKRKTATKALPVPPYPCAVIQLANRLYDRSRLEAWAQSHGVTEQQRKAAMVCLK